MPSLWRKHLLNTPAESSYSHPAFPRLPPQPFPRLEFAPSTIVDIWIAERRRSDNPDVAHPASTNRAFRRMPPLNPGCGCKSALPSVSHFIARSDHADADHSTPDILTTTRSCRTHRRIGPRRVRVISESHGGGVILRYAPQSRTCLAHPDTPECSRLYEPHHRSAAAPRPCARWWSARTPRLRCITSRVSRIGASCAPFANTITVYSLVPSRIGTHRDALCRSRSVGSAV